MLCHNGCVTHREEGNTMKLSEQLALRIDALLDRIDSLETRIAGLEHRAMQQAVLDSEVLATWEPPTTCAMCGEPKGSGRARYMTCKPCSETRTKIIKEGLDRAPIIFSACHACGAEFSPWTRFFCNTCSNEFKMWKIRHGFRP